MGATFVCTILLLLLPSSAGAAAQTAKPDARPPQAAGVFSATIPALQEKTSVPLRLPTYFPRLADPEHELYATVISADSAGYEIVLGLVPDCAGGTACRYGTVIGTTRPISEIIGENRRKAVVKLARDIKGYFYDTVCGANCSDSWVVWTEGKYHYAIGLKAERQQYLMKAANSAITASSPPGK